MSKEQRKMSAKEFEDCIREESKQVSSYVVGMPLFPKEGVYVKDTRVPDRFYEVGEKLGLLREPH